MTHNVITDNALGPNEEGRFSLHMSGWCVWPPSVLMANIPMNLSVRRREIYSKEASSEIQAALFSRKNKSSLRKIYFFFFKWKVISTPQSITKAFPTFQTFCMYRFPLKKTRFLSGFLLHDMKLLFEEINHLSRIIAPKMCLCKAPQTKKPLCIKLEIWIENYH